MQHRKGASLLQLLSRQGLSEDVFRLLPNLQKSSLSAWADLTWVGAGSCSSSGNEMQDGCINVLQSPIGARGVHPRQQEVGRCLEAVSAAGQVAGRLWNFQRRKRNDGTPPAPSYSPAVQAPETLQLPAARHTWERSVKYC